MINTLFIIITSTLYSLIEIEIEGDMVDVKNFQH